MVCSRIFVFLSVTLCSVACLCAQATVSEAEAIQAINDADVSTVKVLKMAERELKEAQNVKRDMDWHEEKAEKRVSEAEAAAKAAVEEADAALVAASNNRDAPAVQAARTKRNTAKNFATNQNQQLQNAFDSYPNVKADTNTAIQSLNNVLLEAWRLDEKEEIEELLDTDTPIDYSKVKESAESIKTKAEALEKAIENAKKLLSAAKSIILRMPAPTKEEFIKKYKADGLVIGAELDNIVGKAKSIMHNIEFHKSQVNQSVETIKNIFKNNPGKVSSDMNGFLSTAQDDLVTISQKMNEAHKSKQNIKKFKNSAEKSKAILNEAKDDTAAKAEIRYIKFYADSSASALDRMKETLKSTGQSVRSAHNMLQSAAEEILKNNGTLKGKVNAVTEKPETIVEDTIIIPSKKEDERKPQQNTEEHTANVTKISTSQRGVQQVDINKGTPVEETAVKPTNNNAVQLSDQRKKEPAEKEMTKPTSKNPNVPTDNKPKQLPEEQKTKPKRNASEGQTVIKPEQSAEGDIEPPQKEATVKSTMINSEKELTETSQNSAHQESDQPNIEKTVQPKDKKSEILDLDKLHKGPKNITKVPLFGENVPASGAWSDGSMIVCVPLLAALIVSAMLH